MQVYRVTAEVATEDRPTFFVFYSTIPMNFGDILEYDNSIAPEDAPRGAIVRECVDITTLPDDSTVPVKYKPVSELVHAQRILRQTETRAECLLQEIHTRIYNTDIPVLPRIWVVLCKVNALTELREQLLNQCKKVRELECK